MQTHTLEIAQPYRYIVAARQLARHLIAAVATAAFVAGCGGSADAPPPSEAPVEPTIIVPVVTTQPADVTVVSPATGTFSAAANGTPMPTVQWQSSRDAGVTWMSIAGATSTTYTTPATVVADSGELFRAVFANAAGMATSNSARLTVTMPGATGLSLLTGSIGGAGNIAGTGATARFNHPTGIAIDSAGNLYVADTGNNTIRKITSAGVVTTLAGTPGVEGGADGTGAAASFKQPTGVAVDPTGNVYVADFGGLTIRKITPAGVVTTLAGAFGVANPFEGPYGITIDPRGTLFVTDQEGDIGSIFSIRPDGTVSRFLTLQDSEIPFGIVAYGINEVYYSSATKFSYDGEGGFSSSIVDSGIWSYDDDDVIHLAGDGSGIASDGTGRTASFNYANGLALDASGNLYTPDTCNGTFRKIVPHVDLGNDQGVVTTVAGTPSANLSPFLCGPVPPLTSTDGFGGAAVFNQPSFAVADASGNMFVVDSGSSVIRKVTPDGNVTTFAGTALQIGSTDGQGTAARFGFDPRFTSDAIGATAVDAAGNVYVSESLNHDIRKITPDGQSNTLAGAAQTSGSADGTSAAASFAAPLGLGIDPVGNLFVADPSGGVIRKVTPAGVVTTFAGTAGTVGSSDGTGAAASFAGPTAAAVDGAGNVFVADSGNNTIRKITPAGVVSTFAGSATASGSDDDVGGAARFSNPYGLAIDVAGNLYVADAGNLTIRKITPEAVVTTIAGTPGMQGSTDGTGAAALFGQPESIAVDSAGNVYVADLLNCNVRKITPAGVVTTLIGVAGEVGVRLGVDPRLDHPYGLSIRGNRLVLIAAGAVLTYALP